MEQAAAIILAYLLGSVSFGIVVSSMRGVDIRSVGSGNPGTSNIMRTLGRRDAAFVLLGDALKGVAAAMIGELWIGGGFGWVTLLAAAIGHSFPIWHKFRGGKSVATVIGGVLFLAPWVGGVLAIVWIACLLIWKTASIGSLVAMILLVPLLAIAGRPADTLLVAGAISLLVIVRHWSNIIRLFSKTEHQVAR